MVSSLSLAAITLLSIRVTLPDTSIWLCSFVSGQEVSPHLGLRGLFVYPLGKEMLFYNLKEQPGLEHDSLDLLLLEGKV